MFCDFIYGLATENMDKEQREEFDYQLNADPEEARKAEKAERKQQAKALLAQLGE